MPFSTQKTLEKNKINDKSSAERPKLKISIQIFSKNLKPNEKIFVMKNSQHALSYQKIKKNWSKSTFFNIVGGVLKV